MMPRSAPATVKRMGVDRRGGKRRVDDPHIAAYLRFEPALRKLPVKRIEAVGGVRGAKAGQLAGQRERLRKLRRRQGRSLRRVPHANTPLPACAKPSPRTRNEISPSVPGQGLDAGNFQKLPQPSGDRLDRLGRGPARQQFGLQVSEVPLIEAGECPLASNSCRQKHSASWRRNASRLAVARVWPWGRKMAPGDGRRLSALPLAPPRSLEPDQAERQDLVTHRRRPSRRRRRSRPRLVAPGAAPRARIGPKASAPGRRRKSAARSSSRSNRARSDAPQRLAELQRPGLAVHARGFASRVHQRQSCLAASESPRTRLDLAAALAHDRGHAADQISRPAPGVQHAAIPARLDRVAVRFRAGSALPQARSGQARGSRRETGGWSLPSRRGETRGLLLEGMAAPWGGLQACPDNPSLRRAPVSMGPELGPIHRRNRRHVAATTDRIAFREAGKAGKGSSA